MDKQIMGGLMAILIGLAAWNMKTVNELQLDVEAMMYKHASEEDIQELKSEVSRLKWILQDYAAEK